MHACIHTYVCTYNFTCIIDIDIRACMLQVNMGADVGAVDLDGDAPLDNAINSARDKEGLPE
jgi:hypothetical protein